MGRDSLQLFSDGVLAHHLGGGTPAGGPDVRRHSVGAAIELLGLGAGGAQLNFGDRAHQADQDFDLIVRPEQVALVPVDLAAADDEGLVDFEVLALVGRGGHQELRVDAPQVFREVRIRGEHRPTTRLLMHPERPVQARERGIQRQTPDRTPRSHGLAVTHLVLGERRTDQTDGIPEALFGQLGTIPGRFNLDCRIVPRGIEAIKHGVSSFRQDLLQRLCNRPDTVARGKRDAQPVSALGDRVSENGDYF